MTLKHYYILKRMHKRSVRLSQWAREQDYYSPLIGLLGGCLLAAWLLS